MTNKKNDTNVTSAGLVELKQAYEEALKQRNELDDKLASIQDKIRIHLKEARQLNETMSDTIAGTIIKGIEIEPKNKIINVKTNDDVVKVNIGTVWSRVKKFAVDVLLPVLIIVGLLYMVGVVKW